MDFYRPTTNQATLDALGTLYRAVRTWRFYPIGHPTRRSSLILSHAAMLNLLDGNTLLLGCGRTGFSFPDGELLKDASGLTAALAYELIIRRVQKITFLEELFQEDLLEFVKILCTSPESIQQSGGFEALMALRGIRSIWVNEFDLTIIRGKRLKIEEAGTIPQGIDDAETDVDIIPVVEQQSPQTDELSPEQQLRALLGKLATCGEEDIYLTLTRQAVSCADYLQSDHKTHLIFPLIELLADHADGEERSKNMRESAQFAIEQIVTTGEILHILLEKIGADFDVPKRALRAVLKAGGTSAITAAIELMGCTNSLKARKTLSTMLASLGEVAVPVLLDLMNDSRWFIVRNICVIFGSIASREALPALTKSLHHPDLRVRKESIRSLAQIGGTESESAILDILHDTEPALYPQAIASLGGMKSRKAVAELIKIVLSRDLFLKSLTLKIDALAAIALIGDRQVTPHLVALLDERHLLAAARGKRLKAAAAACLGKLGDATAVPALKKLASEGGELGSACSDALVMIEKTEGRPDGIS
jgi:HEAT repeat protein